MYVNNLISLCVLLLGTISIFRPFLLIYLFSILPILSIISSASQYDTEYKLIQIGSINIYPSDYLLIILIILLLFICFKHFILKISLKSILFTSPVNKIIFIIFFWDIILGILSYQNGLNIQSILRNLARESLMFLTIIIPNIIKSEIEKERFYNFLILISIILVSVSFLRYLFSYDMTTTSSGTLRAMSGNAIVILIFPICYILFFSLYQKKNILLLILIISIISIGIIFTGHRSGMLVLLFILFSSFIFSKANKIDYIYLPLWAISILFAAILILPSFNLVAGKSFTTDLVLRFEDTFNLNNKTTQDRIGMWSESFVVLKGNPLFGLGTFPSYTKLSDLNIRSDSTSNDRFRIPPHNIFVSKIVQEGLVGLSITIFLFYCIFKQINTLQYYDNKFANVFLFYVLSFLLFSFFNTTFSNSVGRTYLFTIVGFLNIEYLSDKQIIQ